MGPKDRSLPDLANSEHIGPDTTGDNIAAKKVASYVWNPTGGTGSGGWERATAASGGGGAVT